MKTTCNGRTAFLDHAFSKKQPASPTRPDLNDMLLTPSFIFIHVASFRKCR